VTPNSHTFVRSNVDAAASRDPNGKLLFTPPWRKGRSPVKVTEFLRGQKVPLHARSQTPVVLMIPKAGSEWSGNIVPCLVAVHVATKDKWIVDAEFGEGDDGVGSEGGRASVAVRVRTENS
jgi:hypothetical protein